MKHNRRRGRMNNVGDWVTIKGKEEPAVIREIVRNAAGSVLVYVVLCGARRIFVKPEELVAFKDPP